jgi:hypothetical protein
MLQHVAAMIESVSNNQPVDLSALPPEPTPVNTGIMTLSVD